MRKRADDEAELPADDERGRARLCERSPPELAGRIDGKRDKPPVRALGVAEGDRKLLTGRVPLVLEDRQRPAQQRMCPGPENPSHEGIPEPQQPQRGSDGHK